MVSASAYTFCKVIAKCCTVCNSMDTQCVGEKQLLYTCVVAMDTQCASEKQLLYTCVVAMDTQCVGETQLLYTCGCCNQHQLPVRCRTADIECSKTGLYLYACSMTRYLHVRQ